MTKIQFLLALNEKLSPLPKEEAEEQLRFYSEMIEDRMEEGLGEEEAVAAVGTVEEIAAQILSDIPLPKPHPLPQSKSRQSKKTGNIWLIALLILGSPLWFPLLIALFSVGFSLFITFWTFVICLWAIPVSVACAGVACAIAGTGSVLGLSRTVGAALLGVGFLCLGFSVFLFFGCNLITKGAAYITKAFGKLILRGFRKKEAV